MKNSIINFLERSSQAKVQNLKRRSIVNRIAFEETVDLDYNPKTARHKSLKDIGLKPNKY